jgi:hypothetical protein
MGLEHPCLSVVNEWIAESRNLYLVPSLAEDYIALEDLVFECCSEAAIWSIFFNYFFNRASDATDSADLSALEFCYFKIAVKHAFDKSGILMNLERGTDQLQLFHYLELRVNFYHDACNTDSKVRNILASNIIL